MSRPPRHVTTVAIAVVVGLILVVTLLAVPVALLAHLEDKDLDRWAQVGQAISPIGVFFSGIAFIGITAALLLQGRELSNQGEELSIALREQQLNSEIGLRQLHTDLIKMALDDDELLGVWPPLAPGVSETRKDHYCNLILNLQKVAFEAKTIELAELRGALRFLMASEDMQAFWAKARAARVSVTRGDEPEDYFTAEVDRAYIEAHTPPG